MNDNKIKRISNLRDQSFEDAYKVHDVGEAQFSDRLEEFNLQAFKHGDDKRDEDAYSGTGIDLGVQHRQETMGWVEIKTKTTDPEWMGRCNLEHYQEYRGFATYVDEPVFIYFAFVEDVDNAVISDRYFVRVPPVMENQNVEVLPFTSKGHKLVEFDSSEELQWPDVIGSFFDELH